MIRKSPAWKFTSKNGLVQWYGNVNFYGDRVLGQWFCLDAKSGRLLWERRMSGPNTVVGVTNRVIIASETRSDGPWTLDFGCYGISLETGEMLWDSKYISYPAGGWLSRMLKTLFGRLIESNESPLEVKDGKVWCESGRILNASDGTLIARENPGEMKKKEELSGNGDPAQKLYNGERVLVDRKGPLMISMEESSGEVGHHTEDLRLYGFSRKEAPDWTFDLSSMGYSSEANYFAYRYRHPYVYFVVKEGEGYLPEVEGQALQVRKAPARLVTVDGRNGEVVQNFRLTDEGVREYRIEAVGSRGILLSRDNRRLALYPFEEA